MSAKQHCIEWLRDFIYLFIYLHSSFEMLCFVSKLDEILQALSYNSYAYVQDSIAECVL